MNKKYLFRALFLLFFSVFAGQANATISCSFSAPLMAVNYSPNNPGGITALRIMSGEATCTNTAPNIDTTQQWNICVADGAATAVGTGGRSGNDQMAVSSDGTKIPFSTKNARYANQSDPLAAWAHGSLFNNFAWNARGSISAVSSNIVGMSITIAPGINVPANDYMTTIPIPVFINNSAYSNNCGSQFQIGGDIIVNFPVLIRVAGYCEFHPDGSTLDMGRIVLDPITGAVPVVYTFTNFTTICPVGVPYTIAVSDGNNSSGTANDRRRMANTTNGAYFLKYKLSTGSSGTNAFTGGNYTGIGTIQRLQMYAVLTSEVVPMYAGTYSDTLLFFITF